MDEAAREPELTDELRRKLALIADSFFRLTGKPLVDDPSPANLWNASRVIVAHGCEDDPVFFYGNRSALEVFEMNFSRFTQLPSRFSAEAPAREERAQLLERVSCNGYIDDYAGVRISATGKRFRIEQAVVWNLVDAEGIRHGQAATFDRWQAL